MGGGRRVNAVTIGAGKVCDNPDLTRLFFMPGHDGVHPVPPQKRRGFKRADQGTILHFFCNILVNLSGVPMYRRVVAPMV